MFKGASWILFYTILAIIFIIGAAAVILYFKNKKEVKEQALLVLFIDTFETLKNLGIWKKISKKGS